VGGGGKMVGGFVVCSRGGQSRILQDIEESRHMNRRVVYWSNEQSAR
jgi:hypothetical protein